MRSGGEKEQEWGEWTRVVAEKHGTAF